MPFEKGHAKKGGRKKGVIPQKTLILNTFAQAIIEGGMDKFRIELNKLSGKTFVDSYLTLLEYVRPKLARTELTGKDGKDLFKDISEIVVVHTNEIPLNGNGTTDQPAIN